MLVHYYRAGLGSTKSFLCAELGAVHTPVQDHGIREKYTNIINDIMCPLILTEISRTQRTQ